MNVRERIVTKGGRGSKKKFVFLSVSDDFFWLRNFIWIRVLLGKILLQDVQKNIQDSKLLWKPFKRVFKEVFRNQLKKFKIPFFCLLVSIFADIEMNKTWAEQNRARNVDNEVMWSEYFSVIMTMTLFTFHIDHINCLPFSQSVISQTVFQGLPTNLIRF